MRLVPLIDDLKYKPLSEAEHDRHGVGNVTNPPAVNSNNHAGLLLGVTSDNNDGLRLLAHRGGEFALHNRFHHACILALLLAGCSRHFEAKVDASGVSSASADATTHATETRDEAATKTVIVTTRPDGTRREKTIYKGAVAVRRELEADAKTLLSGETSLKTDTESSSKPGGIFAIWPLLLALIPVAISLLKPAWLGIAWGFVKSLFGRKVS